MRIVVAGNPGVGKSTLLNTLVGAPIFRSGVSIGGGLTQECFTHTADDALQYVDTPGLDDMFTREQAAQQLSNALSGAAELKLIFVTTLESGTVRSTDLATIDAVLCAIEEAGVQVQARFSVVVNKCNDGELKQLEDHDAKVRLERMFGRGRGIPNMLYLPLVHEARGARDFMLRCRDRCWEFVSKTLVLQMPLGKAVIVQVQDYQKVQMELEGEVRALQKRMKDELAKKKAFDRKKRVVFYVAKGVGILFLCGVLRKGFNWWQARRVVRTAKILAGRYLENGE